MIERLGVQIPAGVAEEVSSPESTLQDDSYLVSFPSLLPQWHIKDPGHSAKSAGGQLHQNMHTPMTQQSQSGLTMQLSRRSVRTYPETSSCATCKGTFSQSSQLTGPPWTDPGIKSGISVHKLIST